MSNSQQVGIPSILSMQKELFASLRLKNVLDAIANYFSFLVKDAKVGVFLSDNDSLSFKLMSCKGYSEASIHQLRNVPFTAESLLKIVAQKRTVAIIQNSNGSDISAAVMRNEGSAVQIALPLIAQNMLVGAVLIDLKGTIDSAAQHTLKELGDLAAVALANAILYGQSEYERQKLSTLYKAAIALSGSSLDVAQVLQIAADTALVLANTNHCAILAFDKDKQAFNLAAFKGLDGNSFNKFSLSVNETIAGRCLASRKTEYIPDTVRFEHNIPNSSSGDTFGSAVAVPLICEEEFLGVMMLFATAQRFFHKELIEQLDSLGKQVAIAMRVGLTHESATQHISLDAHTGLLNRWNFEGALGREVERSTRHKHSMAVMLVDIDHLSRVNQLLGQEKGDETIKHVAHLVKGALRDIDIPCRYGSEEFMIILPETSRTSASEVAERLRQKVRGQALPGIGTVTISIGVATFPENAKDANGLLQAVEQGLDVAKFEGRDRVKVVEGGPAAEHDISWDQLAKQAKLAVLSERQTRMQSRSGLESEYAPWMRAIPGWGAKKRD